MRSRRAPAVYAALFVGIVGESLEHALRIRERQQGAIAALGQRALAVRDLQTLLPETVRLVADTLEVEFAKILERLPGDEVSLLRAGVGWRPGLVVSSRSRATPTPRPDS